MTLEQYLNELKAKYQEDFIVTPPQSNEAELAKVPKALLECYLLIGKATFPFGRIYPIEEAVKESARPPFTGEWFVFGQDRYFSFWLCSYQKDQRGCCFTTWDHASGSDIGEAAVKDLVSLLKDQQEDYEEWLEENGEYDDDDDDEDLEED